ncbi:hypothetical protein L1987_77475 [Smallanthus sonchifolius]|uniref:Uncharacterized protein n=1 Tax=Smallanthus sonchifolius TaxID=185202 RepID=A0ACB8ZB25_9ASTR|nr:hypothetical protein L1987_77475 [Smallanthus sonchifolius]
MDGRRTMMMNWDGLEDLDDDDVFFDASSSPEEEFEDSRMSFSTAVDHSNLSDFQTTGYDMWMTTPESITDRRRRLLKDMGLGGDKDLLGFGSRPPSTHVLSRKTDIPPPANICSREAEQPMKQDGKLPCEPVSSGSDGLLLRSRSDGSINTSSIDTNRRKEEIIGSVLKQHLVRTSSWFSLPFVRLSSTSRGQQRRIFIAKDDNRNNCITDDNNDTKESILLVKNSDNGKEFMVKESSTDEGNGNWNRLSDVETGNQITTEEFKKNAGRSPKVKEFSEQKPSSQWVKARVHGKPFKEFTALHRSQEIKGHNGSIWAMKFTLDGHYLATAGEDKVVRIWEVVEFDVAAMRGGDDSSSAGGTPVHPMALVAGPEGRPPLPDSMPEKKKGKKKGFRIMFMCRKLFLGWRKHHFAH